MRRIDLKKAQTARLATIRDINRQIVLNYVREREPISRAEIARESALQRSTVSAIIDDLQNEGLVEAIGEGESTGGRPPTLLRLRTAGAIAIGVAITPTLTTIATSDLAGRVLRQQSFPTDPDPERTFSQVIDCVEQFLAPKNESIESIGVSLPGLVDPSTGIAIYIPYFKWRDLPVARILSSATGLPVTIDNDANSVALAELWFGRPEVSGERGAAGEFGHMIIGTHAPVPCSCGNRDCWEAFSSERATLERYRKMSSHPDESMVSFKELVDRALMGESEANAALVDTALCLGIGISNLIVGFSPEAVVVGGEIARAWSLVEAALKETIEHSVRRGLPSARILASTLGNNPTLMGALSGTGDRK